MKKHYDHYSEVPESEWHWPSFAPREIASKGEGALVVDYEAMDKLQRLRNLVDRPMIVTSAYRSPAHNMRVGGAKKSKHLEGIAFDIRMDNHDPNEFEAAARMIGFTGFGFYPKSGFMHIDTGPSRSWGKRWPLLSANELPVEPPIQPESVKEDTEAQAAAGAGVAGALAVGVDYLPILGNLAPTAQLVAVVVAAAFVGYLLWKRTR